MGFTVTARAETKDAEFAAYARLLRQQGKPLGKLPRVPDPANPNRRWVYVWNTKEEAQKFAKHLQAETGTGGWHVEQTAFAPSIGPFGPVLFQLIRRSDGLVLALHTLSLALIKETFTHVTPAATSAFISTRTWNDFQQTHGSLSALVAEIVPSLSGLTIEQLSDLGYAVIDADDDRTWVYVPPAGTVENHGCSGSMGVMSLTASVS